MGSLPDDLQQQRDDCENQRRSDQDSAAARIPTDPAIGNEQADDENQRDQRRNPRHETALRVKRFFEVSLTHFDHLPLILLDDYLAAAGEGCA